MKIPILPKDFNLGKKAYLFPPEWLMNIEDICEFNGLPIWNAAILTKWIPERIEENCSIYVYYDRKIDTLSCFTSTFWDIDQFEIHDGNELPCEETPDEFTDILDLM